MPVTNCFPIAPVPCTEDTQPTACDVISEYPVTVNELQVKTISCAYQLEADCGIDIQLSGYVAQKSPDDAQLLLTLERIRQVRQAWVEKNVAVTSAISTTIIDEAVVI